MEGCAPKKQERNLILVGIGVLKLFKAALLILVGIGTLKLLHKDVAHELHEWIRAIRVDPDSRWFHALLARLSGLDDHYLKAISAGSFFYASLLLIEGVGLILRKRWAEYMTVIITASLIPIEIYEIWRHVTVVRVTVFLLNVAILVYLIRLLNRQACQHSAPS